MLGFCTAVPELLPDPIPVVAVAPVPVPLIDAPPVVEPAELPAAPPACASANVLDSANAVARAIVVSFMAMPLGYCVRATRHKGFMFRFAASTRLHAMAISALAAPARCENRPRANQ